MSNKINREDQELEPIITHPAYYVESVSQDEKPDDTALVAVDVKVRENYIEWFDTEKYRQFIISDTSLESDGTIKFTNSKSNKAYRLSPLTLDLYREKVRDKMYGSNLDFDSEEDLWEALLSSVED